METHDPSQNGNGSNGKKSGTEAPNGSGASTRPVETTPSPSDTRKTPAKRNRLTARTEKGDELVDLLEGLRAVQAGNFSARLPLKGGSAVMNQISAAFNSVAALNESMTHEMVRVSGVVGREGRMGERASLGSVSGGWARGIDSINALIGDLVQPTTEVARVIIAVAEGDLTQKMALDIDGQPVKGEFLRIGTTVNAMVDQLSSFAAEVTRVAKEVGSEGKLGGQADVKGLSGVWKDLTDNVNQLAGNLTTQVRAISDVATAVTKGDLTRSITFSAEGEVAALKDNINQMIVNLKETTQKNTEQDWLKTNLAKFSGMMQGQKNLEAVSRLIMSELTPLVSAHHGAFFLMDVESDQPILKLTSSYASKEREGIATRFRLGESRVGQCALEKKRILLTRVSADYIQISSGLGESTPLNVIVLPVLFEGNVKAVIELASFHPFSDTHQTFLNQLTSSIGVVLDMFMANMRTEELLQQSQSLTQELKSQSKELTAQQEELKKTNVALEKQALELEEKAEQLSLISKYKSEFLANMSHELRTPLNSLLILAKLLSDNKDANLSAKQVEYAQTIYASGGDLLSLINEILDLSKVEAGKMQIEPQDIALTDLRELVVRQFQPVADQKTLEYGVEIHPGTPAAIRTDPQRLQQVLKNLLSNAFKFTETGSVVLTMKVPEKRLRFDNEVLEHSDEVIAFAVTDTGIGIPKDKQRLIFEAFQQADGTTSRKYGGTGLGLAISREIAKLLGGEIRVESVPGQGSSFTLFLPQRYVGWGTTDEAPEPKKAGQMPCRGSDANLLGITPEPTVDAVVTRPIEDNREHLREGDRVLLVIEDDVKFARIMLGLAHEKGFKVLVATRGDTGLALANEYKPDAITLDIQLPVMDGFAVLDRLKRNPRTRHIPVHVISVVDREHRDATVLAADTATFLHRVHDTLPDGAKKVLEDSTRRVVTLAGKKVLIVDDDVRNIFALTRMLENHQMEVIFAENGRAGINSLDQHTDVDVVLMDVMMPEMDGYQPMREIRKNPRHKKLPIIAVTANALKDDREKCISAGASDYLPKPVDELKLIELLKLWVEG